MPVGDSGLADLRSYPKAFLENNALVVFGSNAHASGPCQYRLVLTTRKGWKSVAGSAGERSVPYWFMMRDGVFHPDFDATRSSVAFDVYYVSMREFTNGQWEDTGTTHFVLPGAAGADMMVTSKLNGCTFGIGMNAAGARMVSHLRPPPNAQLASTVVPQGLEAGFAGGSIDYRVMSNGAENGTILGFRAGGNWTFYTQRFRMRPNTTGLVEMVVKLS